ncbi:MAG: CRISPR system precrRNA processing endoribonuclease RAMP protein Cas6 [Armatimonadetes bacterium]|nr:CRISPR system precrRNA processing endoribonuclease RAMP protein Cas6 [Armatimonadota bacterium]
MTEHGRACTTAGKSFPALLALEKLWFSRLAFRLRALGSGVLPRYKGGLLRGVLGAALKGIGCPRSAAQCDECGLAEECLYLRVFRTPMSRDLGFGGDCAPHPFVLSDVWSDEGQFEAGQELSFSLTLVGKAVDWAHYFVLAVALAGERGLGKGRTKFQVAEVRAATSASEWMTAWPPAERREVPRLKAEDFVAVTDGPALVNFVTPLRLQRDGRLLRDFDFPLLVQRLAERVGVLAELYCAGENYGGGDEESWQESARRAAEMAEKLPWKVIEARWLSLKHFSARQKREIDLSGVVGRVEVGGEWQPFWPLLALGQFIHVGKGTSFGCGQYRVVSC